MRLLHHKTGGLYEKITQCRACGSQELKWQCGQRNKTGVQNGLLSMHDVTTEFFLECESCNETLQVVSGDKVAAYLNQSM